MPFPLRKHHRRGPSVHGVYPEPGVDRTIVARLRAEIPDDDGRSLTGRLMGDPLPHHRRTPRPASPERASA